MGVEVDTNHFKGNAPDRCTLEVLDVPGIRPSALMTQEVAWTTVVPEHKLAPHHRHFVAVPPRLATHVRLSIFPDGGVSRLRIWGRAP